MAVENKGVRTCIKCDKSKPIDKNFYKSKSINAVDGRMTICKSCINEMIDENNLDTVKNVLREINIAFVPKYWESAQNSRQSTFGAYLRQINSLPQTQDLGYDDSVVNNADDDEIVNFEFDDEFEVTPQIVRFWGRGYTKGDYIFLEDEYFKFSQVYASDTPVQVNMYKNICKTQLQADKALQNADMDTYKKMIDSLSKLQADANIKPTQDNGEDDAKNCMGVWIEHIERDEPIPKESDEFSDVDNIGRYIREWFTDHMKKIFGVYKDGVS